MIDVTLENFEQEVIAASNTQPVLVDFWAPWCGPCKSLGPILEKLETAYGGGFKLAKIDSDEQQQLASAFGVRSIPTVVLLVNGQPVDGFQGALPESQVREFLDKHVQALAPEDAEGDVADAEDPSAADPAAQLEKLQHAVATDPANDDARFDYVKALLLGGREADARRAFEPMASKAGAVRRADALARWFDAIDFQGQADAAGLEAKIAANKRDFQARYDKARMLLGQQQWTAAMDELLEILMRDKAWSEELARKTYVAILELIEQPRPKVADGLIPPDDPVVATYRRRLSSVVLS